MTAFSHPDGELSPAEVADLLSREEIHLVDVRETYEYDAGRIAGARHVELDRLPGQAETIPRDRPVVFHCRLGVRSAMATRAFLAAGWDARNMAGGIQAWVEAGLPLDPPDGYVAEH